MEMTRGENVTAAPTGAPVYEDYFVNMGPQHPSTHGVLRLVLKLAGETVLGVTPIIGYVHRGVEKMGEAMRVSSDMITRMCSARAGTSMPRACSTASAQPQLFMCAER